MKNFSYERCKTINHSNNLQTELQKTIIFDNMNNQIQI